MSARAPLAGTRQLIPETERAGSQETVVSCPEQVAADPEQILDDAVHRCEPLQMGGRLESSHLPLALTSRLMRDLRSVVFVLPSTVDHGRHHGAVRRRVAAQLVRDQPARLAALFFQELAEESSGRPPIAPRLHQDVEHVAILVHGPPQILLPPPDLDEQLVQMPGVALAAPAVPQPPCVPDRVSGAPRAFRSSRSVSVGDRWVSSKWRRTSVAMTGRRGTIRCLRPLPVRYTSGSRSRRKSAGHSRKSIPSWLPMSWRVQMWGWFRLEMVFASRSNRCFRSGSEATCSGRTLMATVLSSLVSRALYTSPMPPASMAETISYGPSFAPASKGIGQNQPSRLRRYALITNAHDTETSPPKLNPEATSPPIPSGP